MTKNNYLDSRTEEERKNEPQDFVTTATKEDGKEKLGIGGNIICGNCGKTDKIFMITESQLENLLAEAKAEGYEQGRLRCLQQHYGKELEEATKKKVT